MDSKEKLHTALERQLDNYISSTIIKRGWNYYKNGNVQDTKATEFNTLTGVVQGTELYAVVIDAEHFRYSSCTCPFDGYCKHMAAVYFQYCAQTCGEPETEQSYFRLLGLTPARTIVKEEKTDDESSPSHDNPGSSGTVEQWLQWMEQNYGDTWRKCRHSLHPLQPVLSSLKGLAKNWPIELQRQHWIAAIMFVLDQAEQAIMTVDSFSRYYHEMSFVRMAEPWLEHAYELISLLEPELISDEELAWSNKLADYAKLRALKTDRQLFDWSTIYFVICGKLSNDQQWYRQELLALLHEVEAPVIEERNDSFLYGAIAMFYYFNEEDERAIHYFSQGAFERIQKLIYPCAADRIQKGEWDKVEQWMSFLYERVYSNRNARNIGPFMALCRRADEDCPDVPIWTTYMLELLPYAYSELSEHWLSMKKYEEWTDLQLFIGVKAEEIDAAQMREVAKAAPNVLMPLYHQSIEAAISTRNRQGYRLAVKQLKKLERLYKAVKEAAKWDGFLQELVTKNQRLRALQEELRKGKVVT